MISETTITAMNFIPDDQRKMDPTTSKSCESLCSNSSKGSAYLIRQRKPNALLNSKPIGVCGTRQPAIIPATNEVRQRVLSARRLRMKTYQNQLADAQQTIAELAHENRILRTLHKRQDSALSKYESTNAELPQLLHSHAEELRVWQAKYRYLQSINKELEQKLKQKESIILSISDQNKYYVQLNKDKNLEDRQRLTEKLQVMETRLQEKDNEIKMMARKMQLETKQSKQQLQAEQKRMREILTKLEKARLELSGYRKLEDMQLQEKFNMNLRRNRGANNDISKAEREIEKYCLANISETENTSEIEVPNTQKSIKTVTNKNPPNFPTSAIGAQNVAKQQTLSNKSVEVLKRTEQGSGEIFDICKSNNSLNAPLTEEENKNLPSTRQGRLEKFDHDYEEESYENSDEDELEGTKESEENSTDNQLENADENGEYVANIDGTDDEKDIPKHSEDYYYKETKSVENYSPSSKNGMKNKISSIRKEISNDFKEREAFLDTFCRQATNGVLRNEAAKKFNSSISDRSMSNNRKHKLLAAIKAIDDSRSQD